MSVYLVKQLADLEYRLCSATNETIQLGSLVGLFMNARALVK